MDTLMVIVADDDLSARRLMAAWCRAMGFHAVEAGDGDETLALVHQHRPHILCLDLNMPLMSGFEVCRHVRRDPSFAQIAIIVVSGRNTVEDRASAREAGATSFLAKPLNRRDFEAILRHHTPKEVIS